MRKSKLTAAALAMSIIGVIMAVPAFAGEWRHEDKGWWYENDDSTYPVNQWQNINGKQYYFDSNGYMLENTTTPDGKKVGPDGALIQTESVSRITYTSDSVTQALQISDWVYEVAYGDYTYHVFEITNQSPYTISLNINESAKNSAGEIIGAESASERDIPPGSTIFVTNFFSDTSGAVGFDTVIQTKLETYYQPVLQNIGVETSKGKEKVIVKITNYGAVPAEFPEATALFFKNGKVVYVGSTYLVDADSELKPGAVITEQIQSFKDFDEVKVHVTARGK